MTTYAPILVEGAGVLPVSLDEVKLHVRVDGDGDNDLLEAYLNAAVAHLDGAEGWLGRAIIAQSWAQQFDRFERVLRLGLAPVSAISSVVYRDATGDAQMVGASNYFVVNGGSAPELHFVDDYDFPLTQDQRPVLTVTFVGGYGDTDAAPAPLKVGILMLVADMYHNREASIAAGTMPNPLAGMLLTPYRTRWMA